MTQPEAEKTAKVAATKGFARKSADYHQAVLAAKKNGAGCCCKSGFLIDFVKSVMSKLYDVFFIHIMHAQTQMHTPTNAFT